MKKAVIFTLVFILSSVVSAAGFGKYSHGYRMGQLTKFSEKGFIYKSGEGQMLVGAESTPYVITTTDSEGNTKKKVINPWYFSVHPDHLKKMRPIINQYIGSYVVIEYEQAHVKSPKVDTDYEPVKLYSISDPIDKVCIAKSYIDGSKGIGVRVGRIVKASTKGKFVDSHELTIQVGNSGNQFKNMSISKDDHLYQCAVEYLKAGQKVKVYYDESHLNLNVFSRNTRYEIIKIEPLKTGGLN